MTNIKDIYSIYKENLLISTDTRNIISGSVFFALKGENFNGNTFAEKALQSGASYAVVDEKEFVKDDRYLLVKDVLTSLQQLAKYHRDQLNIPVIGITGSNGKTTSKELLNAVLSRKYKTLATKGNLNNHIGVPLTLLSITPDIEIAIVEMGANHQQEIAFLCEIADPDFGLISNVGKAHLEGMGGFKGVKKTKKELYDYIRIKEGLAFVNSDDIDLMEMSADVDHKIYYGSHPLSHVSGRIISSDPVLKMEVKFKGEEEFSALSSQLVGDYNLNNILAALCIGNHFNVSFSEMAAGIEEYLPSNNRSQAINLGSNRLIMDAYNANPSSMTAAILNFQNMNSEKKLMILGDMFELGEESLKEHSLLIDLVHQKEFENVIFVGKDFSASKKYQFCYFETTEEASAWIKQHPVNDHLILVKGSRGMKLETIFN